MINRYSDPNDTTPELKPTPNPERFAIALGVACLLTVLLIGSRLDPCWFQTPPRHDLPPSVTLALDSWAVDFKQSLVDYGVWRKGFLATTWMGKDAAVRLRSEVKSKHTIVLERLMSLRTEKPVAALEYAIDASSIWIKQLEETALAVESGRIDDFRRAETVTLTYLKSLEPPNYGKEAAKEIGVFAAKVAVRALINRAIIELFPIEVPAEAGNN